MDIGRILEYINNYGPAGQAFMKMLGPSEKAWLHYNMHFVQPFLESAHGNASLCEFLGEFQKYVEASRQKDSD